MKTIAQVNKEIARRNRLFKVATPAQKRVLVAKDVLNQIFSGTISAESGKWLDAVSFDSEDDDDKSLQKEFLAGNVRSCSCCALGAVFLSCSLFNNRTTLGQSTLNIGYDLEKERSFPNGMRALFGNEQLELIEKAFESGHGWFIADVLNVPEDEYAANYRARIGTDDNDDDKVTLVAIMQNIVRNKGKFVPSDVTKAKRPTSISRRHKTS